MWRTRGLDHIALVLHQLHCLLVQERDGHLGPFVSVRNGSGLPRTASWCYGASPAMWDHTLLLATGHR